MNSQTYNERIKKLKNKLEPKTLYLFSNPSQIFYFTGFNFLVPNEREAFFICSDKTSALIYTSFSPIIKFDFINFLPGIYPEQFKINLKRIIQETSVNQLRFDANTLFVSELELIQEIEGLKIQKMPPKIVSQLMKIKEPGEIELIRTACEITHEVYESALKKLKVGITELEFEHIIKTEFEKKGIQELAFPTIVAFGENSAKPHHQPGNKKLEENTVVLIDMGAKYHDYCADMTRTVWFGTSPSDQFKKIEKIVLEAYESAFNTTMGHVDKSVLAKDIDNAARSHISNQGFSENFTHTTGHGLGIDIHETPSLSWKNSDQIVQSMLITIEPGVYIDNNFGYRYENTILINSNGCEVLTKSSVV